MGAILKSFKSLCHWEKGWLLQGKAMSSDSWLGRGLEGVMAPPATPRPSTEGPFVSPKLSPNRTSCPRRSCRTAHLTQMDSKLSQPAQEKVQSHLTGGG